MDKNEAVILAKQYASAVCQELSPDKIMLFGSYVNGNATEDSDIDVAVIYNSFDGDWLNVYTRLAYLTREISSLIEPILLDRSDDRSGFAEEILKTGELLYPQ